MPPWAMTRGAYLEPAAVARDPDYAAALVDAGVTIFLLRTGFNPRRAAPQLEAAVGVAERVGAAVWLLAGTWWGHGVTAGADAMALPDAWRRLDRQGLLGDYPAHEAQWPMWAPGGSADAAIAANLEQLAGWNPAAICLTHARFRHPAAIGGLFETGPAWTDALQPAHWERVVAGMRASTPGQLAEFAERAGGRALIDALDRFAQLGDRDGGGGPDAPYADWFARRRTRVRRAESRFLAAARGSGGPALLAGGNAIAPHAAVLSGQHYGELAAHADFVQPLLGYMEWHVFQCGAAWARLLRRCIPGLSEAAALESVWRLFGLHAHSCRCARRCSPAKATARPSSAWSRPCCGAPWRSARRSASCRCCAATTGRPR